MTRVVVVDDQDLVRAGLVALVDSAQDLQVVGQAATGLEAIQVVGDTTPDVVLMDVRMPGMDGITAARHITSQHPAVKVLILTTFDTDENAHAALRAGAAGFLLKDAPPRQLLDAIRTSTQGGAVIAPTTARRLIDHLVAGGELHRPHRHLLGLLTDREKEVLTLVARGCSNRQIADRLYISELTAKTHVSRILTKLNLESRVHAAAFAYESGLVRPNQEPDPP